MANPQPAAPSFSLYKPTAGEVDFDGVNLVTLKGEELRQMRRKMQMIFQDPYASLNPRMTVGQIVGEPLIVHNVATGSGDRRSVSSTCLNWSS